MASGTATNDVAVAAVAATAVSVSPGGPAVASGNAFATVGPDSGAAAGGPGQASRQEMLNAVRRASPATITASASGPNRGGASGRAGGGMVGAVGGITMVGDEVLPVGAAFASPPLAGVGGLPISGSGTGGAVPTPASGGGAGGLQVPPLIAGAMPVTLQGPKGGYLYAKILEAGNLDALEPSGVCCDPLSGGCPGLSVPGCGSQQPAQLRVQFTCAILERANSTSSPVSLDTKTHKALFEQELLMKSLNFCSVDQLTIKLQCKNLTLGEASMPLRVALPAPLAYGLPLQVGSSPSSLHAAEEAANYPVNPANWLPVQRVILKRPSTNTLLSGTPSTAPISTKSEPYIDLMLLQLVDGSLPQLRGTTPLMLAIEQRQEQLVRAYLSLDVAEALPHYEQAACITMAIQRRYHDILVLLLDRIKPLHQHLLLAIRLRAVDLVEALLQAGGAPLLHPHSRTTRDASNRRGGMGRHRSEASITQGYSTGGLRDLDEARATLGIGGSFTEASSMSSNAMAEVASMSSRPNGPQLTPLSVACSLGDVSIVEAICQWARVEKVHVDPTAPIVLSGDTPTVTLGGGGGRGNDTSNNSTVALWWDQDDRDRGGRGESESSTYGDPPMIMALRGRGSVAMKIRLISSLARFGFSADIRSPVDSWTPLLAAVELGSSELVSALVKFGARLSADRQLGFTPLHLACQMTQWHLVPLLTESMCGQYNRVAAWGPSPQYVSLNLVDSYGRTALDIALLHYFANPLPYSSDSNSKSPTSGSERQKAVDILREFVHRSPPEDPGIVCGWELLRVLRFLDALPSKKAVGAQFWGADWTSDKACPSDPKSMVKVIEAATPQREQYGDIEELLQAVRVLVRAGGQTKNLPQDLLQPPARSPGQGLESNGSSHDRNDFKECVREPLGPHLKSDRSCKYSLLDADDFSEVSVDEPPPIRSV